MRRATEHARRLLALAVALVAISSPIGCADGGGASPVAQDYQESQARIPLDAGQRAGNDPLVDPGAAPVDGRARVRSRRALALYRSLDPSGRWAVERAVAKKHFVVWVYTRLGSDRRAQAAMIDACEALHDRFSWATSVLVLDRGRSTMIGARNRTARCTLVRLAERVGGP
jgi:hypothetical protein